MSWNFCKVLLLVFLLCESLVLGFITPPLPPPSPKPRIESIGKSINPGKGHSEVDWLLK